MVRGERHLLHSGCRTSSLFTAWRIGTCLLLGFRERRQKVLVLEHTPDLGHRWEV